MNECAREMVWGGGKHVFNLNDPAVLRVLNGAPDARRAARTKTGMIELTTLKGVNGDTPAAALKRFEAGAYSIPDVELIILYGLWGGGLPLSEADELVERFIRGKPIGPSAVLAFEILAALFVGAVDGSTSA